MTAEELGKEIPYDIYVKAEDVIGKYAYNNSHKFGGTIMDINERGVTLNGSYHSTITGDCVFDSLCINGFKIYEQALKE